MEIDIVYARPPGPGWAPLDHLAALAARYFTAELTVVTVTRRGTLAREALSRIPPTPRRSRAHLLLIAPQPQHLRAAIRLDWLLGRYATRVAWVIDAFWPERIPYFARRHRPFDHYFVADHEYLDVWRRATGAPVAWLPWGSDVVGLRGAGAERAVDVQRLGRQPAAWDADDRVATALRGRGIRYSGRPPMPADPAANHRLVTDALTRAKFAVAFGNASAPTPSTHPTHEYLTGRWTDALACGAAVIGIPPRCHATDELLWPEGLLRLPDAGLEGNLDAVAAAVRAWTPADPPAHVSMALHRLDWRHRLEVIARTLAVEGDAIERGRAEIAQALAELPRPSPAEGT